MSNDNYNRSSKNPLKHYFFWFLLKIFFISQKNKNRFKPARSLCYGINMLRIVFERLLKTPSLTYIIFAISLSSFLETKTMVVFASVPSFKICTLFSDFLLICVFCYYKRIIRICYLCRNFDKSRSADHHHSGSTAYELCDSKWNNVSCTKFLVLIYFFWTKKKVRVGVGAKFDN